MNNTLVKGMQLLESIVRSKSAMGVTELASRLDLGKSNVHRLLQALVELGYVRKNEEGTYQASLKVWELGTALDPQLMIRSAARVPMQNLLDSIRETVHLSILDGAEVLYIAKLDSPEPVRAYSEVGGRAPAHCVATGKAILAWQGEDFLKQLAGRLTRHTESTITQPAALQEELQRVRANGYAVNRGEWRDSVWGVGAPIRSSNGTTLAALGISGPALRVRPAHIKKYAAEVMAAADAVAKALETQT